MKKVILTVLCAAFVLCLNAQDISHKKWTRIARKMPTEWYASEQARVIADTVMKYQNEYGGWPKNINFHNMAAHTQADINEKVQAGATIDNDATTVEMIFLSMVYAQNKCPKYKEAIMRGFEFLLNSQYPNGGWPQFYPPRPPYGEHYSMHITYNDNAIVNVMYFLRAIIDNDPSVQAMEFNDADRERARQAFDRGIQNILDCQIRKDGKLTVWCAQHDHETLAPAKARAYELPSYSGQESVGIVYLLMSVPNPSEQVVAAVDGAIDWFESHKIPDIDIETEWLADGKFNRVVVSKPGNTLWARFYDLETEEPFFCGRDGVKKSSMDQIEAERRNGYQWYNAAPAELIEKYRTWRKNIYKI